MIQRKLMKVTFVMKDLNLKTREVAIVMLADCAEAAVRSLSRPTPGRIEGLIRQIIKRKAC